MWMIFSLYNSLLNILFPRTCFGCGKDESVICDECIQKIPRPLDKEMIYIHSTFDYRDPLIKRIIHAIKYFHRKDLIEPLATILAKEIKQEKMCGVLVPIPMPRLRKYLRGYNQAEHIAKVLEKNLNLIVKNNILKRTHTTKRQVMTKTKQERLLNQKNTFVVLQNIQDLDIILVDDVTTTGATIKEARKTLLAYGAKSVFAVTLAH